MSGIDAGILVKAHPLTEEQIKQLEKKVLENRGAFAYLNENGELCFAIPQGVDQIKELAWHKTSELYTDEDNTFIKKVYRRYTPNSYALDTVLQKQTHDEQWSVVGDSGAELPVLGISAEECTWEQIDAICEAGQAKEYFKLGDTKTIRINGYDFDVVMEIVAFNKDDKADGSGKAAITWLSKDLIAAEKMNSTGTNANGWEASKLRRDYLGYMDYDLTDDLLAVIKPVNKTYYNYTDNTTKYCVDSLWIPSAGEIFGNNGINEGCEDSGAEYTSYFHYTAGARIKKYATSGDTGMWWLRTASDDIKGNFRLVETDGTASSRSASFKHGVVLGFCTGNGTFDSDEENNDNENNSEQPAAGLYQTRSEYKTLLKDWETLLAEETIHVDNGVISTNYTSTPGSNGWSEANGSSAALIGDLVLPNDGSIAEFSENAFGECANLTSVVIPDSVTSISTCAFSGCGLTSIVIPDSVTHIGSDAFNSCSDLVDITMGKGITTIDANAFRYCKNLKAVYITDLESWCNIQYSNNYSHPLGYTLQGDLYLNDVLVTDLTIPNSISHINNYAFYGCYSITSVIIPNGITSIGDSAFASCKAITSIAIPDSVTSIGSNAFSNCRALTSITLPSSITSISAGMFYNCWALPSIIIPDGVTSIGSSAFNSCKALPSIIIPNGVTSIGSSAFNSCQALTSIIIPNGVTSIGDSTFNDCKVLNSIIIPNSVTSIGFFAFGGCSNLTDVYYTGSEADWGTISVQSQNSALTAATIHYNYSHE